MFCFHGKNNHATFLIKTTILEMPQSLLSLSLLIYENEHIPDLYHPEIDKEAISDGYRNARYRWRV